MRTQRSGWLVVLAAALAASPAAEVKVWQGTLTLPTYEEGPPDANPPFDVFARRFLSYPYTTRNNLTGARVDTAWRAVFLENEYLKCSILPDLGGHLYTCLDKIDGQQMFYANPTIKKALIGYRGAWAAFGIEFNFPVSHNWMSLSPVDFAWSSHQDGSASVTVSNIDRVYGMEWNVELILRPGSTLLEEKVTLANRSDVRHRYYWWNNAGVQVWDDSRIEYPMQFTEGHGLSDIDTWPVDSQGVDLSVIANQKSGNVSRFVHGSREPFMGVYHPRTNSGVVHYANYGELPAKKIWSWGADAEGLSWRKTLSDNDSAYVEVQAGLMRNQETYAFLEPGQAIRFEEYWMPAHGTGGITRANLEGVLHLSREIQADGRVTVRAALNANRNISGASIRLADGSTPVWEDKVNLDPSMTWMHAWTDLAADRKYAFRLSDAGGRTLLEHTEGVYDWTPREQVKVGPVAHPKVPPEGSWTEAEYLSEGTNQELNGAAVAAWQTYQQGLDKFSSSPSLAKAAGRLAVWLLRGEQAVRLLETVVSRAPDDAEAHYYLGLAYEALNAPDKARVNWERAKKERTLGEAASLRLAELSARAGNLDTALALTASPKEISEAEERVAILRAAGKEEDAKKLAAEWLASFPADNFLRNEMVKLGERDEMLWRHLGSDPDRVLNLAGQYMRLGQYSEAAELLARSYPAHNANEAEPGMPLPQDDPRVAYYLGYCRKLAYEDFRPAWQAASKMSVRYIFPNRADALPVLRAVLARYPNDGTAHYLLGSLLFSRGVVKPAVEEWQRARKLDPKLIALHYSLGRALNEVLKQPDRAADVFEEGIRADPGNAGLYIGLNDAMKSQGKSASERAAMMQRYPDLPKMPDDLARLLVNTLREAGDTEAANQVIRGHTFARAEGGAPPPEVDEKGTILSIRADEDAPPVTDPDDPFWKRVPAVIAANDPFGKPVPGHTTEVRSRWTDRFVYFLFVCPYETLHLKEDPKIGQETFQLWDWDVAEAFIGSDFEHIRRYKEFELSPQAEWVDLDIDLDSPHKEDGWKWNSGFQVAAKIDREKKVWYGAMKIPYHAVDARTPKPGLRLRINFYRAQGPAQDRKWICWQPTHSKSFHVPESFGTLELAK